MPTALQLEKKKLRARILEQRMGISHAQKQSWDNQINQQLLKLLSRPEYEVIHVYLPMAKEVNITSFIEQALAKNKTVVAPRALPHRKLENLLLENLAKVEKGPFGTRHPHASAVFTGKYDLVIVPGLAFDEENYRLGYGAGYYDTFLNQHPEAYTIGVAYPFQVMEKIPRESHDIPLRKILF